MTVFADLSHHQSTVDLAVYAAARYDRIVLKATEGAGFTDPAFAGRWAAAGRRGLARVAYCYGEAQDNGADDFDHLLAVVQAAGGLGPRDRLCLDVEDVDDGAADYARAQFHVREFTNRAVARGIVRGLLYTGRWYAQPAHVDPSDMPPGWRQLWISQYDPAVPDAAVPLPAGWTRDQVVARQYTSKAAGVAGVAGLCDLSRLQRDWLLPGSPPAGAPAPGVPAMEENEMEPIEVYADGRAVVLYLPSQGRSLTYGTPAERAAVDQLHTAAGRPLKQVKLNPDAYDAFRSFVGRA